MLCRPERFAAASAPPKILPERVLRFFFFYIVCFRQTIMVCFKLEIFAKYVRLTLRYRGTKNFFRLWAIIYLAIVQILTYLQYDVGRHFNYVILKISWDSSRFQISFFIENYTRSFFVTNGLEIFTKCVCVCV